MIAEYPSLIKSSLETQRVVRYDVLGDDNEVQVNYQRVYADGSSVADANSRYVDDETVFDINCISQNVPFNYCAGKNHAYVKSKLRPPCSDNNSTLDTLSGCTHPNGTAASKCVQVGYSQNAYVALCDDTFTHPACGTYIEIHMPFGTLYRNEATVISKVRIEQFNVSGVYTTTIPLTFENDPHRVLCAYQENYLRVGSTVYILPSSPTCCCPKLYDRPTSLGSFQCPFGVSGAGPFCVTPETLTDILTIDTNILVYPYCLSTYKAQNDRYVVG
jgi:hypothetical protein